LKFFKQAEKLIPKITSPKLLILYAKSKESEGQYQKAEEIYK